MKESTMSNTKITVKRLKNVNELLLRSLVILVLIANVLIIPSEASTWVKKPPINTKRLFLLREQVSKISQRRQNFDTVITTTATETSPQHLQEQENCNNLLTTDVAELAHCFQQALVAVNNAEGDIHVGNLLSASERLELSMRKIGFKQSANDIAGNIKKIRGVYDRVPVTMRDSMPELLRYEINTGIIQNNKKFPENSAAMGFLWLGRSLNYQYDMFSYMLNNDNSEPYEAARVAYENDLKPHLSWALQKVCQAAMTTLKPMRKTEMFSQIGGFSPTCFGFEEEIATKRDLRRMVDSIKPMLNRWKQIFSELNLENIV